MTSYSQKQVKAFSRAVTLTGGALFVGIFVFVFQSMELVDQGYRIRDLQESMQSIQSANHELRLQITVAGSIENLTKTKEALHLTETEDVRYIIAGGSQVTLAPFFE